SLFNQTDTRIGIVPHAGEADLLVAGIIRGIGPMIPMDLARTVDEDGNPIGYRLLTGIDQLNPDDRAVYGRLQEQFRFKDVQREFGGKSASNPRRFLAKGMSVGIIVKDGLAYRKVTAPLE